MPDDTATHDGVPEWAHALDGVRIKFWSCPINWHRYVKWHGMDAYCIEPGCDESNIPRDVRTER